MTDEFSNPAKGSIHNEGEVWSVSRLNFVIRDLLQGVPFLRHITVEGEVNNCTYHSSGHIYFSLKDEKSLIQCTFFKGANLKYKHIRIKDGMKMIVVGGITSYPARGNYQLNVSSVAPSGEGELRLRIEQLKLKLYKEGLFDPALKKPLPYLPLTLGVATAPTGAAFQDIIRVARGRFPFVNILLAPCIVQGDEAVDSVCTAIKVLNDPSFHVDVIIAGRGGGSFEDLMAFNEEAVVRAYRSSTVPIISAVGHEIDHPLSDLSADAFAATPSAAAQMCIPVMEQMIDEINDYEQRIRQTLGNRLKVERRTLERIMQARVYLNPASILEVWQQEVDFIFKELKNRVSDRLRDGRERLNVFQTLPLLFERRVQQMRRRFDLAEERLHNFSPLGTLKRGFSVTRNVKGRVIRDADDTLEGEELEVLLYKGSLKVKVSERRSP